MIKQNTEIAYRLRSAFVPGEVLAVFQLSLSRRLENVRRFNLDIAVVRLTAGNLLVPPALDQRSIFAILETGVK